MKISPIYSININNNRKKISADNNVRYSNNFNTKSDTVSFNRLLPENANIKIAFLDIDETLKYWDMNLSEEESQKVRNKLFNHLDKNNIQIVYSSDRGLDRIEPLIKDGTLVKPTWIVCNNGGTIYKNENGKFEEVKAWTDQLHKNFNKDKVRQVMAGVAHKKENMFTPEEWAKIPLELKPTTEKEFIGSKITEYKGHESPFRMKFAVAPNTAQKLVKDVKKELEANNIKAEVNIQVFDKHSTARLEKYFGDEKGKLIRKHYKIRENKDGSNDNIIISASNKGMASEFIRKSLRIKEKEVFASGDGENDFSHADKGYHFALISNAAPGLKNMIAQTPKVNVVETTKPGAEGIIEALV